MLVSFATTGEKTVAAVMSPKNKTVSKCETINLDLLSMGCQSAVLANGGVCINQQVLYSLCVLGVLFE